MVSDAEKERLKMFGIERGANESDEGTNVPLLWHYRHFAEASGAIGVGKLEPSTLRRDDGHLAVGHHALWLSDDYGTGSKFGAIGFGIEAERLDTKRFYFAGTNPGSDKRFRFVVSDVNLPRFQECFPAVEKLPFIQTCGVWRRRTTDGTSVELAFDHEVSLDHCTEIRFNAHDTGDRNNGCLSQQCEDAGQGANRMFAWLLAHDSPALKKLQLRKELLALVTQIFAIADTSGDVSAPDACRAAIVRALNAFANGNAVHSTSIWRTLDRKERIRQWRKLVCKAEPTLGIYLVE